MSMAPSGDPVSPAAFPGKDYCLLHPCRKAPGVNDAPGGDCPGSCLCRAGCWARWLLQLISTLWWGSPALCCPLLPFLKPWETPSGRCLKPPLCWPLLRARGTGFANSSLSGCITITNDLSHRHLSDVINTIFMTQFGKRCVLSFLYIMEHAGLSSDLYLLLALLSWPPRSSPPACCGPGKAEGRWAI